MQTLKLRGEAYIDVAVFVLVIVLLVAFVLSIFPLFTAKQDVNTFAHELAREMEVIGIADLENSEVAAVVSRLENATGLNPNISVSPTGQIQLNESFTVVVSVERSLSLFGGGLGEPITIRSTALGRSERYWKP